MIECPACRHKFSSEVHMDRHAKSPGDMTMCGNCETLLVVSDDLGLRTLTPAELQSVNANQGVRRFIETLRATIRQMKRFRTAARN